MNIIDLHCDTLDKLVNENYSFKLNNGHISEENLLKGGYMAQCFAIYTPLYIKGEKAVEYLNSQYNIFKEKILNGRFDIWIPIEKFLKPDTKFLNPDPYTTICEPGNAAGPMTVTAYDNKSDAIFFQAGRGYTRDGRTKPDFAAPGVNVYGTALNGRYRTATGTSVSAAVAAGCAVLLLSYRTFYTGLQVKNILVKGAERNQLLYPNREWGYGRINIYDSLVSISGIIR
jgi:subtilisin family serine protease